MSRWRYDLGSMPTKSSGIERRAPQNFFWPTDHKKSQYFERYGRIKSKGFCKSRRSRKNHDFWRNLHATATFGCQKVGSFEFPLAGNYTSFLPQLVLTSAPQAPDVSFHGDNVHTLESWITETSETLPKWWVLALWRTSNSVTFPQDISPTKKFIKNRLSTCYAIGL